ncbi:ferric iron uptake transcriptional regulator [Neisseriaceae bacterium PsAf]|nr:ferric iron uptake transcriptional regulator [Neisseriaceae bacterium PsAf]
MIIMSYTTQLKSSGLKVTGPRLKILNLFETHPDMHMSADDVYRIVLEKNMDIGVATVYRVLTQFEEAGILTRHHFDTGKAVYELNTGDHHDHMICIRCGKVSEFFDTEMEELQERIASKQGYEILDHALYIYGICPDCSQKNSK